MTTAGTYAPMCAADMPWRYTARVIILNDSPTIRVKRGPYFIGYYTDPDAIPPEIRRDLEIKEH
jgi:hypothetical protein